MLTENSHQQQRYTQSEKERMLAQYRHVDMHMLQCITGRADGSILLGFLPGVVQLLVHVQLQMWQLLMSS